MIETIQLYPELSSSLIKLLKGLSREEWAKETCIPGRTVKDLASHILDASNLRRLAMQRDNFYGENPKIESYSDLVDFIQKMAKDWILATRRLSPAIIISMLEVAENENLELMKTLKPYDIALWEVAWAGEASSYNWFDIAREYTEKWHHQMQIREAVGNRSEIFTPKFVKPVYDTFMKALPFVYKDAAASHKSLIIVNVEGVCGGVWYLYRNSNQWELMQNKSGDVVAEITISDEIAWQLFTNSIRENKKSYLTIKGNKDLGCKVADMVTVLS